MLRITLVAVIAAACVAVGGISVSSAGAATTTRTWAAYEVGPVDPACVNSGGCDDDNYGSDINSKGWVVGYGFPDDFDAWEWKSGATPTVANLSPFGTDTDSFAYAINTNGDAAGASSDIEESDSESHAVLFKNGSVTNLGTLQGTDIGYASGYGINDSDTVVGESTMASGSTHAFVWTSATGMQDLGTLRGSDSAANAVNGNNQIVGWADNATGNHHAFLSQSGRMTDLGTLGGAESEANSINLSGQIVGWANTVSGAQHAFVRTGSTMTDIGKLIPTATSSVANDITNDGNVVGWAATASGGFNWLYTGGKIVNIDQNTMTCCDAYAGAVNKNLQIVPRNADQFSATIPVLEPVAAYDENNAKIKYSGTWTRAALAGAWGGQIKTASKAGASASLAFKGKRVWWFAPEDATDGQAKVYMDGALKATIDLGQLPSGSRQTPYVQSFSAVGSHTIKITVVGTSGRPKVSVDAFAVSQY